MPRYGACAPYARLGAAYVLGCRLRAYGGAFFLFFYAHIDYI